MSRSGVVRATPDGRHPLGAVAFRGWVDADMVAGAIARWEATAPGQGVEVVTIGELADVPADARAWERASSPLSAASDDEPHTATSREGL